MRTFIILGLVAAGLANAAQPDYTEVRELSAQTDGATVLRIDTGSGSLTVEGVDGLDRVEVIATIDVNRASDRDAAKEMVQKYLKLELERRGDRVELTSDIEQGLWKKGREVSLDLAVRMPAELALDIDDGSGSIRIDNVRASVRVDDGSGSIKIRSVGPLEIDDGSGSIEVEDVAGDVDIIDGSGSITVGGVTGSVTIDDGSGSINVSDVAQNLTIEDAGSGSVNVRNVQGTVKTDG